MEAFQTLMVPAAFSCDGGVGFARNFLVPRMMPLRRRALRMATSPNRPPKTDLAMFR